MTKTCFGSIVCHRRGDPACDACELFAGCHEAAEARLLELRKHLNLETLVAQYQRERVRLGKSLDQAPAPSSRRVKLTPEQEQLVGNPKFPEAARRLVKALFQKGIDGGFLRDALKNAANPFETLMPDELLRQGFEMLRQGFKRGELAKRLIQGNFQRCGVQEALGFETNVINAFLLLGVGAFDSTKTFRVKHE
jgi:hypothetical protein